MKVRLSRAQADFLLDILYEYQGDCISDEDELMVDSLIDAIREEI